MAKIYDTGTDTDTRGWMGGSLVIDLIKAKAKTTIRNNRNVIVVALSYDGGMVASRSQEVGVHPRH